MRGNWCRELRLPGLAYSTVCMKSNDCHLPADLVESDKYLSLSDSIIQLSRAQGQDLVDATDTASLLNSKYVRSNQKQ